MAIATDYEPVVPQQVEQLEEAENPNGAGQNPNDIQQNTQTE